MTKKEFIAAIKTARNVDAYVRFTEHDGWYVKIVKKDLLRTVEGHPDTTIYKATLQDGDLYID